MLNKKTALIVEDEEVSALMLENILNKYGFESIHCTNGKTAFETLVHEQEAVDILISDIVMPDMDGKELLHLVRSSDLTYDLPVILISGILDKEQLSQLCQSYDIRLTKWLSKPVELDKLRSILVELSFLR
ncbi:MAG: response regulator [Deltaproteobacteria bacterium]|nr:response regulator [Deltaproteobacteria bacterium]